MTDSTPRNRRSTPPTPKTVLVTGANAGLGLETARQLANTPGIETIYMACRNEDKARTAIETLQADTATSGFEFIQLDTSDLNSVRTAITQIDRTIDGIILNAGGMGGPTPFDLTTDGVTQCFAVNVLGHVALVEGLIAASKLRGSVVFVGSEASRGIPIASVRRPALETSSAQDFAAIVDGTLFAKPDPMTVYGHVKYVGTLWASAMSRRHPNIRFVTVSPGATTGTNGASDMGVVRRFVANHIAMPMMKLMGRAHGVEQGAKRYLTVLMDHNYESGRFYASPWPSTSGPLVDQSSIFEDLANPVFQDHAYDAVHTFLSKR